MEMAGESVFFILGGVYKINISYNIIHEYIVNTAVASSALHRVY